MKTELEPARDQVIVADRPRDLTIDGIELPDNMRERDMVFGIVIFIGPLVTDRTKVKDLVVYGPYAGKEFVLDGTPLRLLKEEQIEAYVRTKDDQQRQDEIGEPTTDCGSSDN